jgi:GT2 family glycosyltransferase
MSVGRPTVTVVLLSYNRPHLLREALASVASQTCRSTEIIVVDNRSHVSGQVAGVVADHPQVRLIANDTNLGFTGGMNVGIRAARGRYTFLTEDDMVLAPSCMAELAAFMESRPHVGLASGVILKRHTTTIHYAGGRISLGGIYRKVVLGAGDTYRGQYAQPYSVNYVTGAMLFARTDFLRDLGGFREDFFMYHDDDELCARVTRLGKAIMIVPGAMAEHFEPPSGQPAPRTEFHKIKNCAALYLLHAPACVLPEFFVRYGGITTVRQIVARPRLFLTHLRAWAHTLTRVIPLLRERYRLTASVHG